MRKTNFPFRLSFFQIEIFCYFSIISQSHQKSAYCFSSNFFPIQLASICPGKWKIGAGEMEKLTFFFFFDLVLWFNHHYSFSIHFDPPRFSTAIFTSIGFGLSPKLSPYYFYLSFPFISSLFLLITSFYYSKITHNLLT